MVSLDSSKRVLSNGVTFDGDTHPSVSTEGVESCHHQYKNSYAPNIPLMDGVYAPNLISIDRPRRVTPDDSTLNVDTCLSVNTGVE